MTLLVDKGVGEIIVALRIQDVHVQDPLIRVSLLWADRGEMVVSAVRKDEKSGERRTLFGWNDGNKVIPDRFVRGAVFLPFSEFIGY